MRTHIQKLSNIADRLRERDQPLNDVQLVSKALATLPEAFRIVRSVWAAVPAADRTLDHLLQRLLCEESVVRSYQRTEIPTEEAFAAGSSGRGGFRGRGRGNFHGTRGGFIDKKSKGQYGSNTDLRPRCEHCKIPGHEMKNCYKLHGYPGKKGDNPANQALISSSTFDPRSVLAFFADSGATRHMCDQRCLFTTFSPIEPGSWTVSGTNNIYTSSFISILIYGINCHSGIGDTKLDVLGSGSITISVDVNQKMTLKSLPEVLYVPGLGVNLFSIGAATASGLTAEFKDDKVFLHSTLINKNIY